MIERLRSYPSPGKHVLGAALVACIVLIVVAIDAGFVGSLFTPGGQTITARFADTQQLRNGDPVREDGVDIGKVAGMRLDPGGRSATVNMQIQKPGQPIYADATAALRWRTVLGGSYAVDLTPGDPQTGTLGSRAIPLSRTTSQIEIEDLLSFDQGAARQGLKTMLRQLPVGLSDQHAPAAALGALAVVAPTLTSALSSIQGEFEQDLAPLVASTAKTMAALNAPVTTARDVVQGAAVTMHATAQHAGEIGSTLDQLATEQPSIVTTLREIDRTLTLANPLIARLQGPARQVAPTLAKLHPTVTAASTLLSRAQPLLVNLRPAVASLSEAATVGRPLLGQLTPSIDRLANTILPSLAQTDPVTKLKTYELIGPDIAGLDDSAASFDAHGHLFRFPAIGGEHAVSDDLPCTTYFTDPEAPSLIACETLAQALTTYLEHLSSLGATR